MIRYILMHKFSKGLTHIYIKQYKQNNNINELRNVTQNNFRQFKTFSYRIYITKMNKKY